jgi:hypothetical protein
MKSAEYVTIFEQKGGTNEALNHVVFKMFREAKKIGQKRKIINHESFLAVLDEIDIKFRSFHRKIKGRLFDGNPIDPNSFRIAVKNTIPKTFGSWNRNRGGNLIPT